jgi:hypothetical protein
MLHEAVARGNDRLDPRAGAELAAWGLPVLPSGWAATPDEAMALAERLGDPADLQRVAPGLVYKGAGGGAIPNLRTLDGVRDAFSQRIRPTKCARIQRGAPPGLERIIGADRDPPFGPVVMFGAGGVETERQEDVAFQRAPFSEAEAIWRKRPSAAVSCGAAGRGVWRSRSGSLGSCDGSAGCCSGILRLWTSISTCGSWAVPAGASMRWMSM